MSYRWMNRGDRIEAPLVREGNALVATDWDHALARAAELVRGASGKAAILASAGASVEALYLARQAASAFDVTGLFRVEQVPGDVPLSGVPNLALRSERAPNATGARMLGYREGGDAMQKAMSAASLVIALDEPLTGLDLAAVPNLVYLGTVLPEAARGAAVVLPIANVAEEDGTFVNRDALVQRYFQAKPSPGMARPAWWVLGELVAELSGTEPPVTAEEAFARVASGVPAFAGLSYTALGTRGAQARERVPAGVA
jgi:NADH-quinone oxidoreductase subunit G